MYSFIKICVSPKQEIIMTYQEVKNMLTIISMHKDLRKQFARIMSDCWNDEYLYLTKPLITHSEGEKDE